MQRAPPASVWKCLKSNDWFIAWLIDWLIDWLIAQRTDWLINWLIDGFTERLIDTWLNSGLEDSLLHCFMSRLNALFAAFCNQVTYPSFFVVVISSSGPETYVLFLILKWLSLFKISNTWMHCTGLGHLRAPWRLWCVVVFLTQKKLSFVRVRVCRTLSS